MYKQTKIVCTIGPACEDEKILTRMVEAGMNVARLNFSHGDYENHASLISSIRNIEKKTGEPVAILQDLQGPKIRLGFIDEKGIELKKGSEVLFSSGPHGKQFIPPARPFSA